MAMEVRSRRAIRGAGAANGAGALVLLLVLAIVAVRVNQAPPPTVAELQPAARQQIKDAPQGQAPISGPGGDAGPTASPSPSPTPSPSPSAGSGNPAGPGRQLPTCYGNPPRQTEDPQSPPCVALFDGDNGGSTTRGVTRDTIYVAWPFEGGFIEREPDTNDLVGYFNSHFQLYGRKVVLEEFDPTGGPFGGTNPAAMQQDAAGAANGEGRSNNPQPTFASLSYVPRNGAEHYYYDALANLKVLSVNITPTGTEEPHYDRFAPYEWSVVPGLDYDERNLAEMVCGSLAKHPPQYFGSGVNPAADRAFAIGFTKEGDGSLPDAAPLVNGLSACNAPVPVNEDASNATQFIFDAKGKGVSTIMCLCHSSEIGTLMSAATKQQYFPEWVVHQYEFENVDTTGSPPGAQYPYPNEHHAHILGLTFLNKILAPDQTFWYRAIREVDPTYTYQDNGDDITTLYRYEEMMVLFSGLQMAGPHLTAQSFQDGLFRAQFPNPRHGAAPYYQAAVGFAPGLHSFFHDAAPIWWSDKDQNYTTNEPRTGSFCYVAGGVRFGPGQWPGSINFFGGQSCR